MAADPITAVLNIGDKLIGHFFPDKAQQDQAKLALLQLQQTGELQEIAGQLDVNKAEAANASIFVAGWRPYIGWICGTGLGYQFLAQPLLAWVTGIIAVHRGLSPEMLHAALPPSLDMGTLITLLGGMLGFGAMRSFDKTKGTDSGH